MRTHPPNAQLSSFILAQFPAGHIGYGVDIGASDGVSINTTYMLEFAHRWNIISVEANPDYKGVLSARRAFVESCAVDWKAADSMVLHVNTDNPEAYSALRPQKARAGDVTWKTHTVPVKTVDDILAKWEFPRLDLLCIDTEGTELDVLRGCDMEKWKPRVVIVEQWESPGPCTTYLQNLGYQATYHSAHNDCFVLQETTP